MKTACFTGHRNIADTKETMVRLQTELQQLVKNGITDFYAGGALGFDMLAEQAVIAFRKQHPIIKLHLILPCPKEEQTAKWSKTEKEEFDSILANADTIEICSNTYHKECMKQRNQRLVDLADMCICYYNEKDFRSGTGQTVRLAQKKEIPLINVYLC